MGAESEKRLQQVICYRAEVRLGDRIGEEEGKWRSKAPLTALLACLFSGTVGLGGSQRMPTGAGGWGNRVSGEEGPRRRSV